MEISLRGDGLASGGLLVEHRHVHVAEIGEGEGARDRGRGHHQDVDRLALGAERQALVDAEAMLLVDDRDAEVVETRRLPETARGFRPRSGSSRRPSPASTARRSAPLSRPVRSAIDKPGLARHRARCARNAGAPGFPSGPSGPPAARPRWRSPWRAGRRRSCRSPHRPGAAAASSCRTRDRGGYPRRPFPARPSGRKAAVARSVATSRAVARIDAARKAAHPASHQRQGELRGQQLVIGKAAPRDGAGEHLLGQRPGVVRAVQGGERLVKVRRPAALQPGRILPFGQGGTFSSAAPM